MSDIHKAKPGDLFMDKYNKLWRVISVCAEPSICMEEVEPDPQSRGPGVMPSMGLFGNYRTRKDGGISGLMWEGFKRIFSPDAPRPTTEASEVKEEGK